MRATTWSVPKPECQLVAQEKNREPRIPNRMTNTDKLCGRCNCLPCLNPNEKLKPHVADTKFKFIFVFCLFFLPFLIIEHEACWEGCLKHSQRSSAFRKCHFTNWRKKVVIKFKKQQVQQQERYFQDPLSSGRCMKTENSWALRWWIKSAVLDLSDRDGADEETTSHRGFFFSLLCWCNGNFQSISAQRFIKKKGEKAKAILLN